MLMDMVLGVGIEEVEIPIHPVEVMKEIKNDAPHSPVADLHGASSNGTTRRVNEDSVRIYTVLRDLEIPLEWIPEEQITRDGEMVIRDEDVIVLIACIPCMLLLGI